MIGLLRAAWRVRRNKKIHEQWVAYYEKCPTPPGTSCAECAASAKEFGDVEHHRSVVRWYQEITA